VALHALQSFYIYTENFAQIWESKEKLVGLKTKKPTINLMAGSLAGTNH